MSSRLPSWSLVALHDKQEAVQTGSMPVKMFLHATLRYIHSLSKTEANVKFPPVKMLPGLSLAEDYKFEHETNLLVWRLQATLAATSITQLTL